MHFLYLYCALLLGLSAGVRGAEHSLSKRVLPTNENCNPQNEVCRKGDWVATNVADCHRKNPLVTCSAQNDNAKHWIVDVAKSGGCLPTSGKQFTCGSAGTNTRCVCSSPKLPPNVCKCQYWPEQDAGTTLPAFCTGYYIGGTSGLHHWACCNNCNDPTNTCDGKSWHGGSRNSYCDTCGTNTGGGRVKYYFNCGSCNEQKKCADYCSGPIRNLPGLCWQWLDCFTGCCLGMKALQPSRGKRQIDTMSFCGDGTCSSDETPNTCPIDCCYQVNPICSSNHTSICSNECCGDPSCCLVGNKANTVSFTFSYLLMATFLAKLMTM